MNQFLGLVIFVMVYLSVRTSFSRDVEGLENT